MTLYEFYGRECPHCEAMEEKVAKLESEGFEVEQREVWHDDENAELNKEFDSDDETGEPLCGGVPFFYNDETGGYICGETSYERLHRWATEGQDETDNPDETEMEATA